MNLSKKQRQQLISGLFIGSVAILAGSVGLLQYRWIGEVTRADRERMRASLETSLHRIGQDFNAQITTACIALIPDRPTPDNEARRAEYAARFVHWRENNRNGRTIQSIALALPEKNSIRLLRMESTDDDFKPSEWPAGWNDTRQRLLARLSGEMRGRRGFGSMTEDSPFLIDLPYFDRSGPDAAVRDIEWLIVELNPSYVRTVVIPELLQRHLGGGVSAQYHAVITMRDNPSLVLFTSDPEAQKQIGDAPDASARLFDLRMDMMFRRFTAAAAAAGPGPAPGPGRQGEFDSRASMRRRPGPPSDFGGPDRGRWVLSVRNQAGSLEAIVERARMRNLAVTGGILLLMMAAVWALVRYTRRAQQLAELQMEFVAGVSHELRTPLSVMRTAGHNLKGRVANDPARVQRYGALIEEQSEKLTAIVEQVLRFANAQADRVIGAKEPISVASIVDDAIAADRRLIEESGCSVEKTVAPDLPAVMGDANTLRHAVQNLISNAAKYGCSGGWIGVSAALAPDSRGHAVEIRIADHGRGIPEDELNQIFEPFYRGKKAISDQVHGTGLGLSLAKRIVQAHGGAISVRSEEGKGTEFIVRIPVATMEREHEFADSIS